MAGGRESAAAAKHLLAHHELAVVLVEHDDAAVKLARQERDLVAPGDILVTLSTPKGATTLEAFLDQRTAMLFDTTKEAHITIDQETRALRPTYVAKSENEQGLFSVLFNLSDSMQNSIASGEYIKISLPLKNDTGSLLIPIDAVFQNDDHATVLVERDGQAVSTTVTLGTIHGAFAEVRSGLTPGDRIILNRAVIAGDRVTPAE